MNSTSKKLKIVLMSLGIIFALLTIINNNITLNAQNIESNSENSRKIDLDKKCLKISKVSGKIYIDDTDPSSNWAVALAANICTGSGTYSNPYIIKDLVIDAAGSGSCIFIRGSNVFFEIRNCTVYGSEENEFTYDPYYGGIRLMGVSNAKLINNTCSFNSMGILLQGCDNSTFSRNKVNNNTEFGIYMDRSDNNTISGNTVNYNDIYGIRLIYSYNNNISGNIANYNAENGVFIQGSAQSRTPNNVTGNTLNYNKGDGIYLFNCQESYISGNDVNYNDIHGISLRSCNSSTIIRNNATNNNLDGIFLRSCDNNNITENRVNNNNRGMNLIGCNYNTISNNEFIGNTICWVQDGGDGNVFINNTCIVRIVRDNVIIGYNGFILFGILSIIVIIMINKNKKNSSRFN